MPLIIDNWKDAFQGEELLTTNDFISSIQAMEFEDFERAWVVMMLSMQDMTIQHLAQTLAAVRSRYRAKDGGFCRNCQARCAEGDICPQCRGGPPCQRCGGPTRYRKSKHCPACCRILQKKKSWVQHQDKAKCAKCKQWRKKHKHGLCSKCYESAEPDLAIITATADRKRQ